MAKKKKKYYVVWVGSKTGVFETWAECLLYTKGYPNARYKSFPTRYEAEDAFMGVKHIPVPGKKSYKSTSKSIDVEFRNLDDFPEIIQNSISVDAACSGNPGLMEYRGVITSTGQEIFKKGPFEYGTNNIGEFLGLVHGLALLQKKENFHLPIYSDSKIAMGWVRKKKCNTKLEKSARTAILHKLIARAEQWLKENTYKNPVHKWETKSWGEIPADFGRK